MREANIRQIEQFKRGYCRSRDRRLAIKNNFVVDVMSYEELLLGNSVKSYATGSREINGAFIVFEAKKLSKNRYMDF